MNTTTKLKMIFIKDETERILKGKGSFEKKLNELKLIKNKTPTLFVKTIRFNKLWVRFVKENKKELCKYF